MSDINESEKPQSDEREPGNESAAPIAPLRSGNSRQNRLRESGKVYSRKTFEIANRTMVPMALREPIWEQQPEESDEDYALFKAYAFKGVVNGRRHRSLSQFFENLNLSQQSYDLRTASKFWSWELRAGAMERNEVENKTAFYISEGVDRINRARSATEELVVVVAEKAVRLLKDEDEKKLIEFAPYVSILFGPGGAGKFILDGYKAIFGDKLNVDGNFKVGPLEWKPLNGRQPISQ